MSHLKVPVVPSLVSDQLSREGTIMGGSFLLYHTHIDTEGATPRPCHMHWFRKERTDAGSPAGYAVPFYKPMTLRTFS
jgi:hypothetical protein